MNLLQVRACFLLHVFFALTVVGVAAQETNLPPTIGFGESWRYWNRDMAPSQGWRAVDYNDSFWTVGTAQLGYGDGDEATVTRLEPPPHPATAYFRKQFYLGNPAQFSEARIRLIRDDGAVVYINGVEVVRDGMPPGEVGHNTLAAVSAGEDENTPRIHLANISNILRHTNVIAVGVHQVAVSSTDMSFDLELWLAGLPLEERAVVSIVATQPNTSEPLPNALVVPGEFTVFRADPHMDQPLNVYVAYSGTATSADYEPLPIAVLFPAGSNSVKIPVLARTDGIVEGPESVVARFGAMPVEVHDPTSPNRPYIQSISNFVAEVRILDADTTNQKPAIAIEVVNNLTSELNGGFEPGKFRVRRVSGSTNEPIDFSMHIGGLAVNGVDYETVSSVGTIPAGRPSTDFFVRALADNLTEGLETAQFTLNEPGCGVGEYPGCYRISGEPFVQVHIQDGPPTTNRAPNAIITFPANNAVYGQDQPVEVRAEGVDIDGQVVRMELRLGDRVFAATNGPVIVGRTNMPPGEHYIYAYARDNSGQIGNSLPVRIFVNGTNVSSIRITQPQNGAVFPVGQPIQVSATAIDPNGYMPRLEFFANQQRIGVSELHFLVAPPPGTPIEHSIVWSNPPMGSYAVGVFGTDSQNKYISSPPINIVVTDQTSLPVVSITAPNPRTREEAPHEVELPGRFLLTRTGSTMEELVVGLQYDGSATPGLDYRSLPRTVRFAPGALETNLVVQAIDDALREPAETVIARLTQDPCPSPIGLSAWWTADGHSRDISGNGNHGTTHNLLYEGGKVSQAFYFNGTNSYIEIPKSSSLAVTSFTFAAWINPRGLSWQPILEYANPNDVAGVHLWIGAGYGSPLPASLLLNIRDTQGINRSLLVPDVIRANEWSFVAGTFDRGTGAAKLYLNGHQVASNSFPFIIPRTDTMVSIGRRHPTSFDAGAGSFFDGRMDEVEIYGRVLSEAELDNIFEQGANRCRTFATDPAPVVASYIINPDASEATVTIEDNDAIAPMVGVVTRLSDYPVISGFEIATGMFEFYRTGPTNEALQIFFDKGGSATPGADYVSFNNYIVFAPGTTRTNIVVSALDDSLLEGVETVIVELKPAPLGIDSQFPTYYVINPTNQSATVAIIDDESTSMEPRIEITRPSNGANLRTGVPITIEAAAVDPAGYVPIVDFFAGDRLIGTSRIDFIVPPPPGTRLVHTIVWSNAPAGTHLITARGQSNRRFAIESEPIRITVGANDRVVLSVQAIEPSLDETGTNGVPDQAFFRIRRVAGPLSEPVNVVFTLTGTATYGTDYQPVPTVLILPSNDVSELITIVPIPDSLLEGNESVVLTLLTNGCDLRASISLDPFVPLPSCYDVAPGMGRAEIIIHDSPSTTNQPPRVTITAPVDGSVFELGERVHFRAEASDSDGRVVQINMLMDGRVIATTNTFILMNSTNPPVGEHTLLAIARDDDGATNVSQRVRILVRGTNDLAFFERQLPAGFTPGAPFTVRIQARVPSGTQAWGVEDQPPQGWTVSSISDGGSFDSATGKVKFGQFLEPGTRTLSYVVRPPLGANGTVEFAGIGSLDGRIYPIRGQNTISTLASEFHPADRNEDRRIALAEVTGYAAAWKRGETWPAGPNPIPASYVTRAGLIWRQGEAYRFITTNPPPSCWIPLEARGDVFLAASASTVTRSVSGGTESGDSRLVTLQVEPAASVTAYNVEERVPEGWTVQNVTADGVLDPVRRVVRWGLYLDSEERTLSYQLVPPEGVAAGGQLLGEVTLDGEVLTFAGADSVVSVDPATPLRLQSTRRTVDGGVILKLGGAASQICILEDSNDLVNWGFVAELFLPDGELEFTDSNMGEAQQRYYRLRGQ